MKAPLVLYHGPGCMDGFTAAWVAHKHLGDAAEYVPVQYDKDLLADIEDRDVYVLDFCFPLQTMKLIATNASSLTVIDHHVNPAQDTLRFLSEWWFHLDNRKETSRLWIYFDPNKSGARLAWEYFFPDKGIPDLVRYVEDRDLWKWELSASREINASIRCTDRNWSDWDYLETRLSFDDGRRDAIFEGMAILRDERSKIAAICKNARLITLAGHEVLAANAPILQSEVAEQLAENRPFGVCWFISDQGRLVFSLRSRDGFDVSQVAKQYGGGGHKAAAGFSVSGPDAMYVHRFFGLVEV